MSSIGNKEVFARNLHYYLDKNGKTQKEVALAIGVTPASVNEWLNKKKYPRIDKIELLARYFGILKSDLIEDKGLDRESLNERELTEGEKLLLELFRQIPEDSQRMYLEVLRASLKKQP